MGLGGRLAVAIAGLVAVSAILVGAAAFVATGRQVTDETDQFLRARAEEIVDGQRPQPPDRRNRDGGGRRGRGDDNTLPPVEPDAEVQILAADGTVLSNSGIELPVNDRDITLADVDRTEQLRTITVDGDDYRVITQHIPGGGAVQVARSLTETYSLLGTLQTRLVIIAGVMASLAAAAGWVLAQRITRPLRSLTTAVDAVAATQDVSAPFVVPGALEAGGTDEVGRLTRGFDQMLRALHLSRQQQRRLIQDAAHELRTPLTSMKANIEWLARAEDLDPKTRRQTLVGVQRELGELNAVMTEIIELATDSHQLPPFQPLDLAQIAEAAVDRFRARSSRPVTLLVNHSPVRGDADALRRAIANLLSNADKYSPAGSPIIVEVRAGQLWVADSGSGIPQEDRARVFDRFYRRDADRAEPGSGLGLSIVASIINAHGGTVVIEDVSGGGARVGFVIPVDRSLVASVATP